MSSQYRTVKKMANGLIRVTRATKKSQIWTQVKVRQEQRCAHCETFIPAGTYAYRPITNQDNRGDRLCLNCAAG
jgi:flavoprotein